MDNIQDAMSKVMPSATALLEAMAKRYGVEDKNMNDIVYRILGVTYLHHTMRGVLTGQYYSLMQRGEVSGNLLTEDGDKPCVNYKGFISDVQAKIANGAALADTLIAIKSFFFVGTIPRKELFLIARRFHDSVTLWRGVTVNSFWRNMVEAQLHIKHSYNDEQHVGYASEEDLRGLSVSMSRQITVSTANADAIYGALWSLYREIH